MSTRSQDSKPALTMQAIREAHARIRGMIHRTPVMTSSVLDELAGNRLFFKCENLQKVGAFKARGATNAVFLLTDEEAAKGVVTHSSGNHAAALARAARLRGIPAYIVMPNNSPHAKQAAVRRYGGDVVLCEPTLAARESTARQVMERTGAAFIHPYDDLRVMAGQGTTAIELLEDVPGLDMILCPVGGGGQLGGIAVAAKDLKPSMRIVGVEPAGADDAARSLKAGRIIPMLEPRTIADGLKTSLGERPFAEIARLVDDIVTVSEPSIVQAMRQIWEVMKLIVEPSGAVSYAAIVEKKIPASGASIGIVLSGGNLDLNRLPWQD
ncbi:MAG TPA: pyridoxal-phosphate dependent enzyme [Steroidobacteraceae bacterium]|nr:pyridoxal-phosphate dependent enzyme [Steroidobacteraceae bacterium]